MDFFKVAVVQFRYPVLERDARAWLYFHAVEELGWRHAEILDDVEQLAERGQCGAACDATNIGIAFAEIQTHAAFRHVAFQPELRDPFAQQLIILNFHQRQISLLCLFGIVFFPNEAGGRLNYRYYS